ncbi:WG repeat-containing protein [Luedemannella flava]
MLGDVRAAHADAKMSLVHAEATGQLRRIAIAKARLANVLVQLAEHTEADQLFAEANTNELPERLRAAIHHYAGKCAFSQNRYIEGVPALRAGPGAAPRRRPRAGRGHRGRPGLVVQPGGRARLGAVPALPRRDPAHPTPPVPQFDETADRWGYQDAAGNWPIPPQFADVQPFRDGVAWMRPVGLETWGLIDEAGRALIHPANGFLGVASFSDGLAWVSRDGMGGWLAIDKSGRVLLGGNFDDVRPFRRGVAAVRQHGKWGAVERTGRLVVPFAFDAFATGLADGRYVDGFTDEGLAVVDIGGRKGVIDRTGRQIVPPVYSTLVVHPVAFLIVDDNHRWGALDRHGRLLIDPVHASRSAVGLELEELMADSRPLL